MVSRSPHPSPLEAEPRPTILVVEDEPLVRFGITEHLRDQGFVVVQAVNGDEALRLLQCLEGPVDCVFSDIQMPGSCDGLALAQWVAENRPGLPILLTSGAVHADGLPPELRSSYPITPKPYGLDGSWRRSPTRSRAARWTAPTSSRSRSWHPRRPRRTPGS